MTSPWAASVLVLALTLSGISCSQDPRETNTKGSVPKGATGDVESVAVRLGDLTLAYTLDGLTRASSGVRLDTDPRYAFTPGVTGVVQAGAPIGLRRYRGDMAGDLRDDATLRLLKNQTGSVEAPFDGVLRRRQGATTFESFGVDVVAPLTPLQYLRYLSTAFTATALVETVTGQRRVRCAALWLGEAEAEPTPERVADLHCRLPVGVETAPGLRSTVALQGPRLKGVLLVPNVAVAFDPEGAEHFVTVVRDGQPVRVRVRLGISDGVVRVIEGALTPGEVLQ